MSPRVFSAEESTTSGGVEAFSSHAGMRASILRCSASSSATQSAHGL